MNQYIEVGEGHRGTAAETTRVFVYGSLKRGFGNNVLLDDAKFVSEDMTLPSWVMFSLGWFPGVAPGGQEYTYMIKGEVYECNDAVIATLDRLESNGRFYTREIVPMKSGMEAWMYVLPSKDQYSGKEGGIVQEEGCQDWVG